MCAFERQAVLQPAPELQRTSSSAPGTSFFGGASRSLSRALSRSSAASGDTGAAAPAAGGASAVAGPGARARRRAAPPRAALFVHVRFNRMHVAITYKGRLLSVSRAKVRWLNRDRESTDGCHLLQWVS